MTFWQVIFAAVEFVLPVVVVLLVLVLVLVAVGVVLVVEFEHTREVMF